MFAFSGMRFWALIAFGLLLAAGPTFAFDEDHHTVINGATLHFRVRGADKKNPYLVILHGGPGFSSHMFYAWGPSLEKSVNVVYLDQRGCGESARLSVTNPMAPTPAEIKGYTFDTLTADIEGVRQYLRVDKWFVLGHSFGGMLGLEYVAAHPDHVRGFIDMDGLVSVPQMQMAILDNAAKKFTATKDGADLAAAQQLQALPPDNPARLFGAFGLAMGPAGLYFAGDQKAAFAAFYGQIGLAVKPYNLPPSALMPANEPGVALIANDHFLTRDDTPLLLKISVSTLIINGRQDGVITPSSAEAAHAAIKNSQIAEFDQCGHFPFLEQPQKTTAAISAFVSPKTTSQHQEAMPAGDFANIEVPSSLDIGSLSSAEVVIDWVVSPNGRPEQMRVVKSCGSSEMDHACLTAIRKTRFQPAIKNGVPVPAKMERVFQIEAAH